MKFLYYLSPFYRGKSLVTYYHENESPGLLMKAIMRINIIFFLILITCLNVFSKEGTAQINLHIEKGDLETVFKAIEKQTDYSFMYEVSLLKGSGVVSIDVRNAGLEEVLDEVFRGQPFYYEVISKTIVVKEKVGGGSQDGKKTILIKGKVTDKQNIPLVGVSVRIKGTSTGRITDQNGNYTIAGDSGGIIVFSYVGFQTFEIKINGQSEINVTLVEMANKLEETIVKGYYGTTKVLNTGNVNSVSSKEIERQPISDPIAALQGRVSGLFIQQTSGVLGRQFTVRLRGRNSIDNGNDPLFIVDGIQFNSTVFNVAGLSAPAGGNASPFNYLNPSDIQSIDVLKDADATAIYGSRGANGVILITTKKGHEGQTQVNFNIYTGFSKMDQRVNLLNTEQYLKMRRLAYTNDNRVPGVNDHDLNGNWDTTRYTNWQDYFFGGSAPVTEASVNVSGGSKFTNFRIGTTYRSEGTVYPRKFTGKRTSFQFNLNHSSGDERFRINLSGVYVIGTNDLPFTGLDGNITIAPNAPKLFNDDGTLNWANGTWQNPMAPFFKTASENSKNLIGNLSVSYKIIKNLEFKTNLSYNTIDFKQTNLTPFISINPILTPPASYRMNQFLTNDLDSWIIEPQLNYVQELWGGKFEALVGSTFQGTERNYLGMNGSGFANDQILNNFAAASTVAVSVRSNSEYKYNAIYSRLGYSYKNRYVLNLTARRDGSSRFGPHKRFGNFGAIGAAWIFSNENFLRNIASILSMGKLRASYGTTGNDQLGEYKYLSTYSVYSGSFQGVGSLIPTQHTNPLYGWERVNKLELALELGFVDDRLKLNTSIYRNRTNNQLVQYALPSMTGFNSVRANLPAVIQNSGIEIDINSINITNSNFSWSTNFNLSVPRNKLVSYPNIEASSYATRYAVGQPLSISYKYHYTGIDKGTGLYTFQDFNGDGKINSTFDYKPYFIGQNFFGGIQNNLTYKSIELDFLVQYTKQNGELFLMNGIPGLFNAGRGNETTKVLNTGLMQPFTISNSEIVTQNTLFKSSDGLLGDASFFRLKNISLSWQIPVAKVKQKIIKNASVYILGQNLVTIAKYKGFDPETASRSISLPPLRTVTAGLRVSL